MTAATTDRNATQTGERGKIEAFEVGWLFVQEYYTFLNRDPQKLHCFFNKKSCFSHGTEGEPVKPCHGQLEIHNRIEELDFQDCKVMVSNVDSQASLNGGIIVQVLGEMSNKGQGYHKFAQTFFLAEQPNGYYVLNDIFRFLKEEVDDNEYDVQEGAQPEIAHHDEYAPEPVVTKEPVPQPVEQPVVHVPEAPRAPSPAKEEPHHQVEFTTADKVEEEVKSASWGDAPATTGDGTWDAPVVEETPAEPKGWGAVSKPKPAPVEKEEQKPAPQETKPQPASKPAAPAPATPAAPAKPKSWADLISHNANQWAKPAETPAAQPKAAPVQAPKAAPAQPKASPKKPEEAHEADGEHPDSKNGGFREVQGRRPEQKKPQQQPQHEDERERYSIYLKGIYDGIDKNSIYETFKAVGPVKNVDLIASKNIAFVEFTTIESAQKAIGNTYNINGHSITAEERRKSRPYRPQSAGGAARRDYHNGDAGRGRGGDGYHNRGPQAGRGRGAPRDAVGKGGPGPKSQPAKAQ